MALDEGDQAYYAGRDVAAMLRLDDAGSLYFAREGDRATPVRMLQIPLAPADSHGPMLLAMLDEEMGPGILAVFSGLFVSGMFLVLLAADAFSFMLAWELMSVASYFLVVFQHQKLENQRAAFIYLLMAVVGGTFLFLAFGILAGFSDGFSFQTMKEVSLSPTWATLAFVCAFIGFGLKAGIVPLHVWLPVAREQLWLASSARTEGVRAHGIYGVGLYKGLDIRLTR